LFWDGGKIINIDKYVNIIDRQRRGHRDRDRKVSIHLLFIFLFKVKPPRKFDGGGRGHMSS
jgi:hypothetical protein